MTTIIQAVKDGNKEEVKRLLEQKANPDHEDNQGDTPLLVAARENFPDIALLLLLHWAKPNYKELQTGLLPLVMASMKGHEAIVKLLLVFGANPNIKDKFGKAPLEAALHTGNTHIANMLRAAGAEER